MYSIAVLDDEAVWAQDLCGRIMGHPLASQFEVLMCMSASELVGLSEKRHIDILFADIRLSGAVDAGGEPGDGERIDGIDVVSKLDLQARGTQVVYVTGLDGMYARVRRSQMAQFLMKPVRNDELYSVIDKAVIAVCSWKPKLIKLSHPRGDCLIDPRDVLYVESDKREVVVHFRNGKTRRFPMRLSDMRDLLPDFFCQVHRSFIVNMGYAFELHRNPEQQKASLELTTGDEVDVARGRWRDVREALIQYEHRCASFARRDVVEMQGVEMTW